jgi:hypothetical protein
MVFMEENHLKDTIIFKEMFIEFTIRSGSKHGKGIKIGREKKIINRYLSDYSTVAEG